MLTIKLFFQTSINLTSRFASFATRIPSRFLPYFSKALHKPLHFRGNVIDMYERRARAFQLAEQYAHIKNITWDLVLFIRLDSAFYSPQLDFKLQALNLLQINNSNTNTTLYNKVATPRACNFHYGVCDRILIGLWKDMKRLFVSHAIFFLSFKNQLANLINTS